MKKFVCLVCVLCTFIIGKAQRISPTNQLCISTNKTTSLIFPFAIKHVDRGSKDVLVQQITEADNLLFVKASAPRFKETNLSIVTADGQLYSFTVVYDSMPSMLVYRLATPPADESVSFRNEVMNRANTESYAKQIVGRKKSIRGIKSQQSKVAAEIDGIFIKDNVIFYKLQVHNKSSIGYDVDLIRFYVRDKKQSKRTASQEVELKPLYISDDMTNVKAKAKDYIVVAFEKFTIPDAKFFAIEIMEKNGGRHLLLKIKNDKIIKAKAL